jgi:hypothetical protein
VKPYGWRRHDYRDDCHGPCSKYRKLTSKQRATSRRLLHQRGRRDGVADVVMQLKELGAAK